MTLLSRTRLIALAATALMAAASVSAHQLWLEQDDGGARLFFGEFGENLREVSPGLLDKFGKPQVRKVSAQGSVQAGDVTRTATAFTTPLRAGRGESLVAEDATYPMWALGAGQPGRGMYLPAARLVTDLAAQSPQLTLDLVPTGSETAESTVLQAYFSGKPLAGAKVKLVTASGWEKELRTDADGKVTAPLPWNGTYVLELEHTGPAGVRADGASFERGSYVTSLTLLRGTGLAALPAPPAAKPGK